MCGGRKYIYNNIIIFNAIFRIIFIYLFSVSRLGNKPKSPDRMATSCYNSSNIMESSILMTQSLDPTILGQSVSSKYSTDTNKDSTTNGLIERCLDGINSTLKIQLFYNTLFIIRFRID